MYAVCECVGHEEIDANVVALALGEEMFPEWPHRICFRDPDAGSAAFDSDGRYA